MLPDWKLDFLRSHGLLQTDNTAIADDLCVEITESGLSFPPRTVATLRVIIGATSAESLQGLTVDQLGQQPLGTTFPSFFPATDFFVARVFEGFLRILVDPSESLVPTADGIVMTTLAEDKRRLQEVAEAGTIQQPRAHLRRDLLQYRIGQKTAALKALIKLQKLVRQLQSDLAEQYYARTSTAAQDLSPLGRSLKTSMGQLTLQSASGSYIPQRVPPQLRSLSPQSRNRRKGSSSN